MSIVYHICQSKIRKMEQAKKGLRMLKNSRNCFKVIIFNFFNYLLFFWGKKEDIRNITNKTPRNVTPSKKNNNNNIKICLPYSHQNFNNIPKSQNNIIDQKLRQHHHLPQVLEILNVLGKIKNVKIFFKFLFFFLNF